jgi:2-oxoisovalerate dehydrogenase E1 component alpha subunit
LQANQNNQKPIAQFEIQYQQFCDAKGNIVAELPDFARDTAYLIDLYSNMVETRVFDSKAIALQRTGKMGTYASVLGQEAIGTGIAAAMRPEDVLCPYYREVGAQLIRGVAMEEILLYWGGDERGSAYQNPKAKEDFPVCVPIASQTLHAVGVAMAFKLRKEPRVVVTTIGDGGTSRGDFYEAMNLAGIMKLPVVFVVNNNQWAISVARENQTAAKTLAQKGIACGLDCEQIDGNDVIAVRNNVGNAIAKARKGDGPSLREAMTYRICDHTTADDARRYREALELEKHKAEDPIARLAQYLLNQKAWDENKEQALQKKAQETVAAAVQRYQNTPMRSPENMFDHLYETLPEAYFSQREEAEELMRNGNHHGA